jgi:hypothetical protein
MNWTLINIWKIIVLNLFNISYICIGGDILDWINRLVFMIFMANFIWRANPCRVLSSWRIPSDVRNHAAFVFTFQSVQLLTVSNTIWDVLIEKEWRGNLELIKWRWSCRLSREQVRPKMGDFFARGVKYGETKVSAQGNIRRKCKVENGDRKWEKNTLWKKIQMDEAFGQCDRIVWSCLCVHLLKLNSLSIKKVTRFIQYLHSFMYVT